MKAIFNFIILLIFTKTAIAQHADPREITKTDLINFNKIIDKEIPSLKKKLANDGYSEESIIFSLDTFRIHQIATLSMDINYTTIGMNDNINNLTIAYDKLMNKYYKKLLATLKGNDKNDLIKAQTSWLTFRNLEISLIYTLSKTEYSGGGTIQSNIAMGATSELTVKRTEDIFNYYISTKDYNY